MFVESPDFVSQSAANVLPLFLQIAQSFLFSGLRVEFFVLFYFNYFLKGEKVNIYFNINSIISI